MSAEFGGDTSQIKRNLFEALTINSEKACLQRNALNAMHHKKIQSIFSSLMNPELVDSLEGSITGRISLPVLLRGRGRGLEISLCEDRQLKDTQNHKCDDRRLRNCLVLKSVDLATKSWIDAAKKSKMDMESVAN